MGDIGKINDFYQTVFPIEYWSIEEQQNKKVAVHMGSLNNRSETISQLKEIVGDHLQ